MEPVSPEIKQQLPPTVITIFGVTGNLSQIKLLPALYHLLKKNLLPDNIKVLGVFRQTSIDLDTLMQQVAANITKKHGSVDEAAMQKLTNCIQPIIMDSTNQEDYVRLKQTLDELDDQADTKHQHLFYLAIPPDIFSQVMQCLKFANLHREDDAARRILVEKPFGTNLASAKELVHCMADLFAEEQIYRIDHYLAKENAQNILTFRFSNPLIEGLWSREFIDHIQITVSETIGVESRGNFYEGMGALRDIVQSHLLQLMALVMMETPATLQSDDIHKEKLALLQAVQPIKPNHVDEIAVRGQYEGYREEVHNPKSNTETYAAISLQVANSRWGGVPVLLQTGKALKEHRTEVNVVFKDRSRRNVPENVLTIRIQPNEGIGIKMTAKKPGFSSELQPVDMQFRYQDSFDSDSPDAYERVLVDAIGGDQSLFASSEEVLRCWEILEPIVENWQYHPAQPTLYEKGSAGPSDADALSQSYGSHWL